jgi:hypothetical protein
MASYDDDWDSFDSDEARPRELSRSELEEMCKQFGPDIELFDDPWACPRNRASKDR